MSKANQLALEAAYREWNEARTAFYQAQRNFDNADPAYIDIAVQDLKIAEERMDTALRKLKMLQGSGVAV